MIHIIKQLEFLYKLCDAMENRNEQLALDLVDAEIKRLKAEVIEFERTQNDRPKILEN